MQAFGQPAFQPARRICFSQIAKHQRTVAFRPGNDDCENDNDDADGDDDSNDDDTDDVDDDDDDYHDE